MRPTLKKFAQQLFPHQCLLCDLESNNQKLICENCFDCLPHYQSACRQCGLPLTSENQLHCGQCIANPPPFDNTFALFDYAPPISMMIWQLKFHGNLMIAQLFAQCFIDFIEQFYSASTLPDLIIPVPLHFSRLKERGFNQALEIAKPIGKYFNIPVDTKKCIRIKNTQAQSSLPAHKRKNNVDNAFGLSYAFSEKQVVILDDVMTTGNTVSEIAHLLKNVGVRKVDVWCCARANLH
ncbi:MAG TPA: ComF family protein [Coxiellaceae bacterium]|nr:MAG: hypothetical protein A3E81_03570 [Gammaproteobacteria bacterium RIFCSPHIGHO2_12_FULL_36_30]HLB56319.1 ComF family protein [Coxiellaceae bacterium]